MWSAISAAVDLMHALFMAIWVLGLPLLFVWSRWPRLARAYAVYAIAFIGISQLSHVLMGECFLTTLARMSYQQAALAGATLPDPNEWFTVRLAEAIFDLTPTHRGIKLAGEALILLTAAAVMFYAHRLFQTRSRSHAG